MFTTGTGTSTRYLGPGHVTAIEGPQIRVRLDDETEVQAWIALAFPYEPAVEDILLVIGEDEHFYVIGVLHGTGRVALTAQGDISLHAVNGQLSLSGDKGVSVAAPDVEIRATNKLSFFAKSVVEKCTTCYRWVKDLLTLRAGKSTTMVDDQSVNRARQHVILSEETVKVNGKQIHLGS